MEVKARRGTGFGAPAEAVTALKRRKLARTALAFLSGRHWHERSTRFDVIEVLDGAGSTEIRHLIDAFRLWPSG